MDDITIIPVGKKVQQTSDIDDPLHQFQIAAKDDDASPNYYGFTNQAGEWYIMKETLSAGNDSYRYAKGGQDFPTNWTNRVSLTYDYFNVVF